MNAVLLGVVAALCWGLHDFLLRLVSRSVSNLQSVLIVFIAGATALLAAMLLRGESVQLPAGEFWIIAFSGITYALAFVALFAAFAIGPVSLVAPIVCAYPLLALLWAAANGRPPTALEWLAVAGIVAGVMLVARYAIEAPPDPALVTAKPVGTKAQAILYSALACIGFSASLTAGQIAAHDGHVLSITFFSRLWGLAVLILWSLRDRPNFAGVRRWLPVLILMGLLDALALTSVVSAGTLDGAEFATVAASTFGAVTVVLAVLFLKERLMLPQILGMLMILVGVAVLSGRS